jgi:CheY-like chemotaxis protein
MTDAQILVVEDENIVAKDIQNRLKNMGYQAPAICASGEDAIDKVAQLHPDLVLMDIMLKGQIDGIQAAERIRSLFNIPVIYLTAYSDESTLERAKISEPFGYLLKPFEERELHTTIEMALYKHRMEKKLKESEQWLSTTLKSIGDAVIATDRNGRIAFMNPVAENLTGWTQSDAFGHN